MGFDPNKLPAMARSEEARTGGPLAAVRTDLSDNKTSLREVRPYLAGRHDGSLLMG
jgi:hypothetical protein